MAKALLVVRLSRVTDATTSPERQLQICRDLCSQRDYEIVGVAEDLDVSGAVDPFDRDHRPNLSRWLAGEEEPFDVIVAHRVDRFTRSIRHLRRLVDWADDGGKLVVSATEPHFDMSSPFSAVVIALIGTVAEMELEGIRDRNASAARHNIAAGKYRGGVPPWGYIPDDSTGEWRLVQDPPQVKVINEVVRRVLAGEPLRPIAQDLTQRKVLTTRDRFAQIQGREVKGYEWHSAGLKRSLTSPTLMGYVVTREAITDAQGRVQRTPKEKKLFGPETIVRANGTPVVRAEPILKREVFDRLVVELGERENRKEPTRRSSGLLLQIVHCGICERPAYRLKGGPGRSPRYRCASIQKNQPCGNKSVPCDYADEVVESILLRMLGESERLERIWDSGSDHSAELAEVNATLTDLASQVGTGPYRAGTPQRAELDRRIAEYDARQQVLAAEAVEPAGWTWQPTGEKFSDWWDRQDTTGRNIWLRSMNIRLTFEYAPGASKPNVNLDLGDLGTLTQQLKPTGPAASWQKVFAAMSESGIEGMTVQSDGSVEFTPGE